MVVLANELHTCLKTVDFLEKTSAALLTAPRTYPKKRNKTSNISYNIICQLRNKYFINTTERPAIMQPSRNSDQHSSVENVCA